MQGYKNEKYRKYQKEYAKKNSDKKAAHSRKYFRALRKAILELMGGKCIRCNFSDERALQIDHVNGGGVKEMNKISKVYHKIVIQSVLNNEKKYQLLCANCNWIKRSENNENRKK